MAEANYVGAVTKGGLRMSEHTIRIGVRWQLPGAALALSGDLLSSVWPVGCNLSSCELHIPSPPRHPDDRDVLRLGSPAIVDASKVYWRLEPNIASWGAVQSWTPSTGEIDRALVSALLFVIYYDGTTPRREFAEQVGPALNSWADRLVDWLKVRGHLSVTPIADRDLVASGAHLDEVFAFLDGPRAGEEFHAPDTLAAAAYIEPLVIPEARWQAAVENANSGNEPPLSHQLMSSSYEAYAVGKLRQAVIDAATACEVALSASLRRQLNGVGAKTVERLVDRAGLSKLVDLHAAVAGQALEAPRDDVRSEVGPLRNKVAHRGHSPTRVEAQRAIRAAAQLVNHLEPVSVP